MFPLFYEGLWGGGLGVAGGLQTGLPKISNGCGVYTTNEILPECLNETKSASL